MKRGCTRVIDREFHPNGKADKTTRESKRLRCNHFGSGRPSTFRRMTLQYCFGIVAHVYACLLACLVKNRVQHDDIGIDTNLRLDEPGSPGKSVSVCRSRGKSRQLVVF
jgi:hypothetical protein